MNDSKNNAPRVTVLLPVYNAAAYVKAAVESILTQTYTDFELLILNDGSTDETATILSRFTDQRMKIVNNPSNFGLIATLNKGLELCDTELIARMDADDLALPDRLKLQVAAFDADPNLVVCGSNYFTENGSSRHMHPSQLDGDALKAQLLFTTCFNHPTVMMKHPFQQQHIRFESEFLHCEDYRFWTQMAPLGKFRILSEALLIYRIHPQQITAKHRLQQFETSALIRKDYLQQLGLHLNLTELALLNRIGNHEKWGSVNDLTDIESLLILLLEQNQTSGSFESSAMHQVLQKTWIDCCGHSSIGLSAYSLCLKSELIQAKKISIKLKLSLFLKCFLRKVW